MRLHLHRTAFFVTHTGGRLYIDGRPFCVTIEDRTRDAGEKVAGMTAIPRGEYRVTLSMSPRFKRMLPEIHDVPGFDGIRIHEGNTADDTSGCILVGQGDRKALENGRIINSRVTMEVLLAKIKAAIDAGGSVTITID